MQAGKERKSKEFHDLLDSLYLRELLELFVLDEVHCVKNMGDDFRPAYK